MMLNPQDGRDVCVTVYIVDIEAVDTRYTKQWKTHSLPVKKLDLMYRLLVEEKSHATLGVFTNFRGTNVYKLTTINKLLTILRR